MQSAAGSIKVSDSSEGEMEMVGLLTFFVISMPFFIEMFEIAELFLR